MAPPGTRAVIYIDAVTRASWGPRGIDVWYCGPVLDHYRCGYVYVPEHRSMSISSSFDLFPQHCIMPTFTPEQHAREVQHELVEAIQKLPKKSKSKLLKGLSKKLQYCKRQSRWHRPAMRVNKELAMY